MKGGDKPRALIEATTTLPLTADYLHELGLSEVARIKNGFEETARGGLHRSLNEFFDYVRTDEQFKPESREAPTQSYYEVGEEVSTERSANISRWFPRPCSRSSPTILRSSSSRQADLFVEGTDGSRPARSIQRLRPAQPPHHRQCHALPARRRAGASLPDQPRARERGFARLHALWRQHRLCRGLGALFGDAGLRDGVLRRPVEPLWDAAGRTTARHAAGGRYGPPRQGLEP